VLGAYIEITFLFALKVKCLMKNKLESTSIEAIFAQFEVQFWYFAEGTEEIFEKPQ
jgi:hypothetical protein